MTEIFFHREGECPKGVAWADKAYYTDLAHSSTECSNYGICNRATGTCECFNGYSGPACERGVNNILSSSHDKLARLIFH